MNKKLLIKTIAILLVVALAVAIFLPKITEPKNASLGNAANQAPNFVIATSSTFTVTTSSLRLLSTSSATRRLGATFQPVNCTANGTLFLRMEGDIAAVANTRFAVLASTTQAFSDYPQLPVVQGSVQGIVNTGTCTVLVTEWRSQY